LIGRRRSALASVPPVRQCSVALVGIARPPRAVGELAAGHSSLRSQPGRPPSACPRRRPWGLPSRRIGAWSPRLHGSVLPDAVAVCPAPRSGPLGRNIVRTTQR